ncbi:MAG: hypothetical protein FWD82_10880, partial [Defluviitaleaceae bacterium]|nr:hypothetical protein [Defluviitaleaceae bacterium]
LEHAGISWQKLQQLDSVDQLKVFSQAFRNIQDEALKYNLANTLFGGAGVNMVSALSVDPSEMNQLVGEFHRLGLAIGSETFDAASRYRREMMSFRDVWGNITTRFMTPRVFDALSGLVERITNKLVAFTPTFEQWGDKLAAFIENLDLDAIIARVTEFGARVWEIVQKVKDMAGGWGNVAKILGVLAIAPTVISALKFLMSVFKFIKLIVLPIIKFIIKPLTAIAKIMGVIVKVAGAIGKVIALISNPIGWIIIGIGLITAAIIIVRKNWDKIKEKLAQVGAFFKKLWGGIKDWFLGIWDNIKNFFFGIWERIVDHIRERIELIKAVFARIKGWFTGLWDSIKASVRSFIDRILEFFAPFIRVIEGVRNVIGGLFGRNRNNNTGEVDLPGHYRGGIFTHRHIAEVCEKGAEAIIPLDRSNRGRAIWEQAGKMGGYMKDIYPKHRNVIDITNCHNQKNPDKKPKPKPFGAIRQQMAGYTVKVEFSQHNTFYGDVDSKTVKQVEQAGKKGADDTIKKFEEYQRNKKRVAYG